MSRGEPLIRQWNLLKAMQAYHYGLCADDLALRLECSKRQVQRDLKVLQEVGFPVSYEERDYGKRFWKLSSHFIESASALRPSVISSVTGSANARSSFNRLVIWSNSYQLWFCANCRS